MINVVVILCFIPNTILSLVFHPSCYLFQRAPSVVRASGNAPLLTAELAANGRSESTVEGLQDLQ